MIITISSLLDSGFVIETMAYTYIYDGFISRLSSLPTYGLWCFLYNSSFKAWMKPRTPVLTSSQASLHATSALYIIIRVIFQLVLVLRLHRTIFLCRCPSRSYGFLVHGLMPRCTV
ncbi:hypothetical protein F4813DRAFT_219649 [Daldinia decipiens]|uniref:uncharacterized protein n=1 Tax=Daldinia decipiens TaxID=326647 RepID=UPI0020C1F9FC|nr:uncharacterized protein F4813DRAFT_219649 [Daldinia decipiens]KAI1661162.1 hypothetical protein F4813DRAFT_219649 [Daldinia decipiens]